ncbi:MAG: hypothetical protein ACOCP8_08930 [archaeon]
MNINKDYRVLYDNTLWEEFEDEDVVGLTKETIDGNNYIYLRQPIITFKEIVLEKYVSFHEVVDYFSKIKNDFYDETIYTEIKEDYEIINIVEEERGVLNRHNLNIIYYIHRIDYKKNASSYKILGAVYNSKIETPIILINADSSNERYVKNIIDIIYNIKLKNPDLLSKNDLKMLEKIKEANNNILEKKQFRVKIGSD